MKEEIILYKFKIGELVVNLSNFVGVIWAHREDAKFPYVVKYFDFKKGGVLAINRESSIKRVSDVEKEFNEIHKHKK